MPRLMSFALTRDQILDRSKTVTRRLGWAYLKPGDRLTACNKVMGRKGAPLERLAELQVTSIRREPLSEITPADVIREGFPSLGPADFVAMFCRAMHCAPEQLVTRIEFDYQAADGVEVQP